MADDPPIHPDFDAAELARRVYRTAPPPRAQEPDGLPPEPERRRWSEAQKAVLGLVAVIAFCCMVGLAAIAATRPAAPQPDPWCDIDWWGCVDAEDELIDYDIDARPFDPDQGLFGES